MFTPAGEHLTIGVQYVTIFLKLVKKSYYYEKNITLCFRRVPAFWVPGR